MLVVNIKQAGHKVFFEAIFAELKPGKLISEDAYEERLDLPAEEGCLQYKSLLGAIHFSCGRVLGNSQAMVPSDG